MGLDSQRIAKVVGNKGHWEGEVWLWDWRWWKVLFQWEDNLVHKFSMIL